jgi:hypothetical protein
MNKKMHTADIPSLRQAEVNRADKLRAEERNRADKLRAEERNRDAEKRNRDMQHVADVLKAKAVANTRAVVNQMFTEDEVTLDVHCKVDMQLVAEALMAEKVRVKKLTFNGQLSIGDAQALRDALQVNTSVKELDLVCVPIHVLMPIVSRH